MPARHAAIYWRMTFGGIDERKRLEVGGGVAALARSTRSLLNGRGEAPILFKRRGGFIFRIDAIYVDTFLVIRKLKIRSVIIWTSSVKLWREYSDWDKHISSILPRTWKSSVPGVHSIYRKKFLAFHDSPTNFVRFPEH